MKETLIYFGALVVGLISTGLASRAQAIIEVPIIVTDTFGNQVTHFRVEISSADEPGRKVYESPRSIELPVGRLNLRISASLHRSVTEEIEASPLLTVLMVGLVRPTGSEITGEGSPANPSIRVSVGQVDMTERPPVLRVVGVYSSFVRDYLVRDHHGEVELTDLPFGEYRAFLFENARAKKEFELVNEEFKPTVFSVISKSK